MPRSPGTVISRILNIFREIEPQSVLDVGCGWGEYGFLLRFHMERPELWPKEMTEGIVLSGLGLAQVSLI